MKNTLHPGTHLEAEQINAFVEGALPQHERKECLVHMAQCAECRDIVFLSQEPLPFVAVEEVERVPFWRSWMGSVALGAATLACAVVVLVSLKDYKGDKKPEGTEIAEGRQSQEAAAPAQPAEPVVQPAQPPVNVTAPRRTVTPTPAWEQAPQAFSDADVKGNVMGGMSAPLPVAIMPSKLAMNGVAMGSGVGTGPDVGAAVAKKSMLPPVATAASPASSVTMDQIEQLPVQGRANTNQVVASRRAIPQGVAGEYGSSPSSQVVVNAAPSFRAATPSEQLAVRIEHNQGSANGRSEITGSVKDASGAVVPGAVVLVRAVGAAGASTVKTDEMGRFTLESLDAGKYEITIQSPGFERSTLHVDLQPRDLALMTPVLRPGAASQTVNVNAAAVDMDSTNVSSAQLIVKDKVHGLPSKLATVATATSGEKMIALDAAGTLYFTHNAGKRWKAVKPLWEAPIAQVALAPGGSAGTAGAVFQMTTNGGTVWLSLDGEHWRRR
jgi:hypothetical protein